MVRQILRRIVKLEAPERRRALEQFLIISGLRPLGPIIADEGRQEASQETVRRLLENRFGVIPLWAEARLAKLSAPELDDLAVRMLDRSHREELF